MSLEAVSPLTTADELQDAVRQLLRAPDLLGVSAILRNTARRLVGSDGIALVIREGDFCHYVEEDAVGPLWKGKKFPMAACISGWSMLKRQTVVISDITMDKRIPQDLYAGTFVRSLVMTPIANNPPVGALGAYWRSQGYRASPNEVASLTLLADVAGFALADRRS